MNAISTFLFLLGGAANLEVIKKCSQRTQIKYRNLGLALVLTVVLAFIGGADIAHQFTNNLYVIGFVGFLWAAATLSFDFFLIYSEKSHFGFKALRMLVGISNIAITITALFVLLNNSTIDSQIRLNNSGQVNEVDSTYLSAKESRYVAVAEQKESAQKYYTDVVEPEKRSGYPGPKYAEKLAAYESELNKVKVETSRLDSLENTYFIAYENERSALLQVQSNDFFAKARILPGVMLMGGWLSLVLAVCLFFFLTYIELQAIIMKVQMDDNDEYHKKLDEMEADLTAESCEQAEYEKAQTIKAVLLDRRKKEEETKKQEFGYRMIEIEEAILRGIEHESMMALLHEKGYEDIAKLFAELPDHLAYKQQAAEKKSESTAATENSEEIQKELENIIGLSEPMRAVLKSIVGDETDKKKIAERIFDWIEENIEYHKAHGQFFYRNSKYTFNDGRGVCGEMALLYIAFLREMNIKADFTEVTVDDTGEDVRHACVQITFSDGEQFLSDIAYHQYRVKHKSFEVWSDPELIETFKSWNQ